MTDPIDPSSSHQPKKINQPPPRKPPKMKFDPQGKEAKFDPSKHKPGSMGAMFAKFAEGNPKLAHEMLQQTLHLASITIMQQMNHLIKTMREHNKDV